MNVNVPISVYRNATDNAGRPMPLSEFIRMGKNYYAKIMAYRSVKETISELSQKLCSLNTIIAETEPIVSVGVNPLLGYIPDEYSRAKTTYSAAKYEADQIKEQITNCSKVAEKMKRSLPGATFSGLFEPTRKESNLKQHSGFICIDIDDHVNYRTTDGKNIVHVQNLDNVESILSDMPFVWYGSHSVGGKGYFALIPLGPVDEVRTHQWYFECLEIEFQQYGLIIDPACKDVTRLRFLSFDKQPYINNNAVEYMGRVGFLGKDKQKAIEEEKRIKEELARRINANTDSPENNLRDAIRCVELIESSCTDITEDYLQCIKIGKSLFDLGTVGLDLWYRVCRFRSSNHTQLHSYEELSHKWRTFSNDSQPVHIGYFFNVCKRKGILAWPK